MSIISFLSIVWKIWKNISDRSVWHKTLRPSLFYEIWRDCVCKRESLIMVMVCSGLLSALGHIWWWCTLGSVQREELTWAWLTLDWDWAAPAPMSEDTRLRRAGRVARDPDSLLLLPSPAAGNIYHMSPTSGIRRQTSDNESGFLFYGLINFAEVCFAERFLKAAEITPMMRGCDKCYVVTWRSEVGSQQGSRLIETI